MTLKGWLAIGNLKELIVKSLWSHPSPQGSVQFFDVESLCSNTAFEAHVSPTLSHNFLHHFRLSSLPSLAILLGIVVHLFFFWLASRPSTAASMDRSKEGSLFTQSDIHELSDVTPGDTSEKLGNEWDQRGMVRIGKKQELRREFQFFSITGYAMILGCSWEFALM